MPIRGGRRAAPCWRGAARRASAVAWAVALASQAGLALRATRAWRAALAVVVALAGAGPVDAEVDLPLADQRAPIEARARASNRWKQGDYDVWHLRGDCQITQGRVSTRSREAVLWIVAGDAAANAPGKVIAYLEGDVSVEFWRTNDGPRGTAGPAGDPGDPRGRPTHTLFDKRWLGRFYSLAGITVYAPVAGPEPSVKPAAYYAGLEARQPQRLPPPPDLATSGPTHVAAQFTQPEVIPAPPPTPAPNLLDGQAFPSGQALPMDSQAFPSGQAFPAAQPSPAGPTALQGVRNILITPRSSVRVQAQTFTDPVTREQVAIIDAGVRIIIDGVTVRGLGDVGKIDLETDRVVIWTAGIAPGQGLSQQTMQSGDTPLEFYMEGNIVFRQGDRVIYADRMYYNVNQRYGTILAAEMLTPVPSYQGLLRLKADVLRQVNEQSFEAYGAAITSSRLGVPRYWAQSERVRFEDVQTPLVDPVSGLPAMDPITGETAVDHTYRASAQNNFVFVGGLPVFYWPILSADLTKPSYYVDSLSVKSDNVFGTQLLIDFDAHQLLGIDNPPGVEWKLNTDFLSKRGPALGTEYRYEGENLLGFAGPHRGFVDAWGIYDQGQDNLGADRRSLTPEAEFRGRVWGRHRHRLGGGWEFAGQVGLISDRNFLEQYFEREWDEESDQLTSLELKNTDNVMSTSLFGNVRLNDFFTQTEWLPRLDHYVIGASLPGDFVTWHAHSHIGYGRLRTASAPDDPADAAKFDPLAWEVEQEGLRAGTRHELDLPFELGPVKFVLYGLGDATYWQNDLAGAQADRLYGQAGLRASLPFSKVDPAIQSVLLNLNGLAHKVTFEGEFLYADADENFTRFPLYDPLDDDSGEHFRRRFFFDTFGGAPGGDTPLAFDERHYAFRSGLQGWVASPSAEIADDLMQARLAVRQRWQTKRGLPGQQRVIDWIVFDVEGAYFPRADEDNFGQEFGQLNYQFRWHVGDRVTLVSDGYADLFGDGLRTASVGGILSRPGQSSAYLGFRMIEGPISSNILSASANYRLSEKWIASAGASIDFGDAGNIGQSLSVTRIGESALVQFGVRFDASRGDLGLIFAIEPRFLPNSRLGRVAGVQIPPAGAYGLE